MAGEVAGEGPEQRRTPGAALGLDQHALAVGQRDERSERPDEGALVALELLAGEREPPVRGLWLEVLEAGSWRAGLGAVDGVDVDEGRMALATPRLARRSADKIAVAELTAADLRGRDVDVALVLGVLLAADEAMATRGDLEHAGDRRSLLILDDVLLRVGLVGLGVARAVAPTAATAPATAVAAAAVAAAAPPLP